MVAADDHAHVQRDVEQGDEPEPPLGDIVYDDTDLPALTPLACRLPAGVSYEEARPLWGDIDLDAITHNLALIRERAGRPVRVLAAIKANAYGHGVEAVALHLQSAGVDGLATANLDDALAARRAGVSIRILMYGSALPGGLEVLVEHDLTPSIWTHEALTGGRALAAGLEADA